MITAHELVQSWADTTRSPAGVARMRQLARSPETRALGDGPQEIEVRNALATWTMRQRSTAKSHIPVIGLRHLLHALKGLPPTRKIQQVGLKRGEETGLIFFDPITSSTLGTVIVKQSASKRQRSMANFRLAAGLQRSEDKVRPVQVAQQRA